MSLRRRFSNFLLFLSLVALFIFVFDLASLQEVVQWPALMFGLAAFGLGVLLRLGAEPAPPPPPPPPKPAAPKPAPAPKKPGPFAGLFKPKSKPAPPAAAPGKAGPGKTGPKAAKK